MSWKILSELEGQKSQLGFKQYKGKVAFKQDFLLVVINNQVVRKQRKCWKKPLMRKPTIQQASVSEMPLRDTPSKQVAFTGTVSVQC